jgi:hypothetical protein
VFHALLARVLMVLSMLLKGTINVANRDVSACVEGGLKAEVGLV